MLLMPNKKKVAALIVSGLKKPAYVQKLGEESDTGSFKTKGDDEEDEAAMGPVAAMEALLKAIEVKDAKAMASALEDFVGMCGEEPEADSGEE